MKEEKNKKKQVYTEIEKELNNVRTMYACMSVIPLLAFDSKYKTKQKQAASQSSTELNTTTITNKQHNSTVVHAHTSIHVQISIAMKHV